MDKFMTVMIERMMKPPPPPPDPIDTFVKLQTILTNNPAIEAPEPEDPPLDRSHGTHGESHRENRSRNCARQIKSRRPESGWAPFAPVISQFVTSLPTLMAEFRHTRQLELQARELAFKREMWLRTAQPGTPVPKELLETNPPPPVNHQPAAQPQAQPGAPPDAGQLTNAIIQTICHGFDQDPSMGGETAATIAVLYGRQIEALGLEKFLADEQSLTEYVKGIPVLSQRAQFATWPQFQQDFLEYCQQRWGVEPEDEERVNGQAKVPGPQPVA